MEIENWQKVEELLNRALELDASERGEFIEENCANEPLIRREIESLLECETKAMSFLGSPSAALAADFFGEEAEYTQIGQSIGNYKIISEIGAGGMGVVFLAERNDGEFAQQVAVKIIRQTIADSQIIKRFKSERQILASLNHPNITRLLDGGISRDGSPFLAMEYVEGLPITEYAALGDLNVEEKLELFLQVCAGVSFAHRNLIVHRDLKPSNVFVTVDGKAKLLDFGLAKLLDESLDNDAAQTQTAFRALTPAYASPEQIKGEPITTASDIYSLGVILYELLTGEQPFHFKNSSLEEAIHVVCETNPPAPSRAAAEKLRITNYELRDGEENSKFQISDSKTADQNQKTEAVKSNTQRAVRNPKSLRGDVDNIVLKALRKEPERRYSSVEQFAADIERHLKGLPVSARPNTFSYRAEKFVSRNKIGVAAGTLILLLLIGGIAATSWQTRVARVERDTAQRERVKAERVPEFLEGMLGSPAASEKGRDVKVIDVLDESAGRVERELADQPDVLASVEHTLGFSYGQIGNIDAALEHTKTAMDLTAQVYSENSTKYAFVVNEYANILYSKGDYAGSEKFCRESTEIFRQIGEGESKEVANNLILLGLLFAKGESARAEPFLREAVEIRRTALTGGSPLLSSAESALGECLAAQNKFQDAEPLTVGSYEALDASQGRKSFNTLDALKRTIKLYEKWNKPENAERFRAKLSDAQKDIR